MVCVSADVPLPFCEDVGQYSRVFIPGNVRMSFPGNGSPGMQALDSSLSNTGSIPAIRCTLALNHALVSVAPVESPGFVGPSLRRTTAAWRVGVT